VPANDEDRKPTLDENPKPTLDEDPKPTLRARIQGLGRLKAWLIGLGAVAGALTTLLTLVFLLVPGWKPTGSPTEVRATLSNLQAEPDVTLREYLRRPGVPLKAGEDANNLLREEELDRVGSVIYFDVELKGFEGECCHAVWSMYDAKTKKLVSEGLTNQSAWPSDPLTSRSQVNSAPHTTWVPLPRDREGPFLVRLEIYTTVDGAEVRRDYEDVTIDA
jgi:hypothetical protein